MLRLFATLAFCLAASAGHAEPPSAETIILVRHAEKPAAGLGQLSCQGLNRALALPAVLLRKFGRPDAIFAPDPAIAKPDHGQTFDYVRPLATIEPAAIAYGRPVDASLGYADIKGLQARLSSPALRNATVFVAWEHTAATALARALVGKAAVVPAWNSADFDSIYVIRMTRGEKPGVTFERQKEALDGLSANCP